MRPSLLWVSIVLAATATATGAAPARHARQVLGNGLVVLAVEDQSAAVAAVHLAVRFQGAGAPAPAAGVAALSQQMAQLSMDRALGETAWRPLAYEQASRGVIALNTEIDFCEARGQVTDGSLPRLLGLFAHLMFGRAACTAEELAVARRALAQEGGRDSVIEATYYRFLRALYGSASPLAQPVVGDQAALAKLTAADIDQFRQDFMGPNNATLCVIGPRPPGELVRLAEAAFGDCRASRQRLDRVSGLALEVSDAAVLELPGWKGASVLVGVPVPDYGTRGFLMAQLVYMMLAGDEGRIAKDPGITGLLGNNRIFGRVEEVPVELFPPMAGPRPFLAAHVVTHPRQMELARALLVKHLTAFADTAPGDAELSAAKTRLINSAALTHLSRLNFAKAGNCCEFYGAKAEDVLNLGAQAATITAAEVQAMARACFQNHAVGVVIPGDSRERE